jgi:iron(III) transport system ATP-binding protein
MTAAPVVAVSEISRRFVTRHDSVDAVRALSFTVPEGTCTTLLGPSGCGKSTVLRIVAGLETPDSGRVVLDGRTVHDESLGIEVPVNRRRVGMVFQSYAVWPHMTVFENVAYPLRATGVARRDVSSRVMVTLELVGMASLARRRATQLSGGQQQRVALARALVAQPRVLLLDEPLSNLDAVLRVQMQREIREIQRGLGITMLYVTHDQDEALALSDRMLLMHEGRLVQQGTPQELYDRPTTRFAAGFIGKANVLEVLGSPDVVAGRNVIETPAGSLRADVIDPPVGRVRVVIRPEAIRLELAEVRDLVDHPARVEDNRLPCVVEDLAFRGEAIDVTVKVGGATLVARMPRGPRWHRAITASSS